VLASAGDVPAAAVSGSAITYQWSAGFQIDHLMGLASDANEYAVQRLICHRTGASDSPPMRLSVGAVKTGKKSQLVTVSSVSLFARFLPTGFGDWIRIPIPCKQATMYPL
jgi:hypothetical protein